MKIAVYNEKGGAGKTTVAVSLTLSLGLPLLDLDSQPTATRWLERRSPPPPMARRSDPAWIADCPPGISPAIAPVLAACDLVIIPVRASFPDLVTLPDTLAFLRASTKAKLAFVGSDVDRRTNDESALRDALTSHALSVLGVLSHRASYRRAGLSGAHAGEIDPVAAAELRELIKNLTELLK